MRAKQSKKRKSHRFILIWRVGFLSFLLLVCLLDWFVSTHKQAIVPWQSLTNGSPSASAHPLPASKDILRPAIYGLRPGRVAYPYSVIAGGVQSIQELKNAIARDPVVSAHYSEFHIERARIIRLDRERSMHVSYRLGNQVYWTKRELKLAKGETLITAGAHTARTRCGNQIAEMMPVQASPKEPTPEELDTPVAVDSNNPLHVSEPGATDPVEPTFGPRPSSGGKTPPVDTAPPGHTNPILYVPFPGPPPVVKVPEPGTAILFLTALPAFLLIRKRKWKEGLK